MVVYLNATLLLSFVLNASMIQARKSITRITLSIKILSNR